MKLNTAVLLNADRGHILKATATFSGKPVFEWLTTGHPSATGSLPTNWHKIKKLKDQHVVEALAAAAPNHCIDGWSYISRATSAFLAGDLHAARHLSYYVQLRASLSILARIMHHAAVF
jgi:hypothetical protein